MSGSTGTATSERSRRRVRTVGRGGGSRGGREVQSLADQARDLLLEDIIQCRLRPGDVVQLSTLADRYGMSRMPIREAMTRLQHDGLVMSLPYKGYSIRTLDIDDINEIHFMRQLLEGAAAGLAASSVTEDEISRLEALTAPDTMIMTLDYDRYARSFHSIVAKASRNRRLEEAILRTYNDVRRLMYAGIGHPHPELVTEEHRVIVEALRSGDPDVARQAMVDHVANIRQRALDL